MTWIRWECDTPTSDVVMHLAEALNIEPALAHGLYAGACCGMGRHQQDGKLTAVTDTAIEQWALWRGKRGRFAAAFRARCMDGDGELRGWWRQDALFRKQENDRRRAKQSRENRATGRETIPRPSQDSPVHTDGRTNERTDIPPLPPAGDNWLTPWLELYREHVGTIAEARLAKLVAEPRATNADAAWRSFRHWCTDREQRKYCPKIQSWSERWRSFVPTDLTGDTALFPKLVGAN